MSLRVLLVAGFAVAAAAMTGLYAHNWLQAQRSIADAGHAAPAEPTIPLVEVLVATEDLPVGTFVRPETLDWEPWPENAVKDVYAVAGRATPEDFVGSVVRTRVLAGEPISATRIVHPGEQGFLAAVLQPGLRAVSVPVDAASGIAGFVFPGDRVDVVLSYRINSQTDTAGPGRTRHYSQTLLHGVRVLAVDQAVDNAEGTAMLAKTVTLEVDRKQVEKLALAMDLGTLSLSLRSLMATTPDATAGPGAAGGGDPAEDVSAASFTRDIDLMYISPSTDDEISAPPPSRPVDVLHGTKAEQVVF